MITIYPVIFTDVGTNILIEVPDLHILTEANEEGKEKGSLTDAIAMARDAIALSIINLEDSKQEIPIATSIADVDVEHSTFYEDGKSIISFVDVDTIEYRRKQDNRSVRRSVTLPNWLNQEAEKAHINVSRVLQNALMQTLNIN